MSSISVLEIPELLEYILYFIEYRIIIRRFKSINKFWLKIVFNVYNKKMILDLEKSKMKNFIYSKPYIPLNILFLESYNFNLIGNFYTSLFLNNEIIGVIYFSKIWSVFMKLPLDKIKNMKKFKKNLSKLASKYYFKLPNYQTHWYTNTIAQSKGLFWRDMTNIHYYFNSFDIIKDELITMYNLANKCLNDF